MTKDHYPPKLITMLEAVWGQGFLSPGGPDEVARIIGTHDFTGKTVLDIGCGAGGIDLALVQNHGAGYVLGIDVEDPVLARLQGAAGAEAARFVGRDFVNHNIKIWARMIPVLDSGEHCPSHLFGQKAMA